MLSSLIQCLNTPVPMADCPNLLAGWLAGWLGQYLSETDVLPIEAIPASPPDESDHVVFES